MANSPSPEAMVARGWNVFPCGADKRPLIPAWKQFQRDRVSPSQVKNWQKGKPRAWAVVTGKVSDVLVLDFDGAAGTKTLETLGLEAHVRTGSGGYHVYVRYPGWKIRTLNGRSKQSLGRIYPGLDIRGDGGYAIFCGSNRVGSYEWLLEPDPIPFESLPVDLKSYLKHEEPDTPKSPIPHSDTQARAEALIAEALIQAQTIGRNNAGFRLATRLRDSGYSRDHSEPLILSYAARVPKNNAKGGPEIYTHEEALASLRQAFSQAPRKTKNSHHGVDSPDNRSRRFDVRDSGVFFLDSDPDREPLRICSKLEVLKKTRDDRSEGWGRLLQWKDHEGMEHRWPMSMCLLSGSGDEYRSRLLDGGLEIEPGKRARELLTTYIQTASSSGLARCVPKLGWHGDAFVLPDLTIGSSPDQEEYIFQSPFDADHNFRVRGTLDEWRREIGLACLGNSRLTFAVCIAFAAPLLSISESESGGFHIWGASSLGKSTALMVAGSVWGGGSRNGYVESWRTTTNALESYAELHNDSLACLDEISQVGAAEAVESLYMLANGQGKGRMTKTIGMRRRLSWTILLLSSGELTLREHAETAGKQTKAGGEIRLANIPADAGSGRGLFEDLHSFPNAAAFSSHLKEVSKKFYGSPIRKFLAYVAQNRSGIDTLIRSFITKFCASELLRDCSGEVMRVARRFGVTAAAGELASQVGLTGWRDGDATRAIEACLRAWIRARGTVGPTDINESVRRVAAFIELHGASRFQQDDLKGERIINRAGFVTRDEAGNIRNYCFLPEVFRNELCVGTNPEMVARELLARDFLDVDGVGRLQKKVRIAGQKNPIRVYVVKSSIMSIGSGDTGDTGDNEQAKHETKDLPSRDFVPA
jgi:putative DNA primase/helicase